MLPANKEANLFPIVGFGASAGGLETLEPFLCRVPEGGAIAFVIAQHLDPTHKGIMAELLQRSTGMKIRFSPAGVLVSNKGDFIYINGRNGACTAPGSQAKALHGN